MSSLRASYVLLKNNDPRNFFALLVFIKSVSTQVTRIPIFSAFNIMSSDRGILIENTLAENRRGKKHPVVFEPVTFVHRMLLYW